MKSEAVNEEKLQEVENNYPMTPWPQFELPHDPDMNRDSGGDGIPAELFQILKDDAVKVLHSICQQILENSAVATGLEKVRFHSNPKERQCQRMLKLPHDCSHLTR